MESPISMIERSPDGERTAMERGFAQRETWAFEAAYRSYARLLMGAAYGVLRDAPAAEDCVHDVIARLWQRGHAYRRERGALSTFLAMCVRNEALSRARRDANRIEIERKLAPTETQIGRVDDPFERERIARALATLSEEQRVVLMLSYERGLTHAEIARELNAPLGTVKSRLSSALRNLRAIFVREEGI